MVKVGVFGPGWLQWYQRFHWNDGATTFNVTSSATAASTTTTGPTTTTTVPSTTTTTTPAGSGGLPARPAGWPSTMQLGVSDSPGGAAALKASIPVGFRNQYLAGGVNTGNGWASWNANGDFVRYYIEDSPRPASRRCSPTTCSTNRSPA